MDRYARCANRFLAWSLGLPRPLVALLGLLAIFLLGVRTASPSDADLLHQASLEEAAAAAVTGSASASADGPSPTLNLKVE